jgi:DNA-binding transcriptional MerR regulator
MNEPENDKSATQMGFGSPGANIGAGESKVRDSGTEFHGSGPEIRKLYFSTKEASEALGISPYTLKSWERKFPPLKPAKTKSGKRLYKPADIVLLEKIRDCLGRGMTDLDVLQLLEGEEASAHRTAEEPELSASPAASRIGIGEIRRELEALLEMLKR